MKTAELERLWGLQPGELVETMRKFLGGNATLEEIDAAVTEIMNGIEQSLARPYQLKECLSYLNKDELLDLAKTIGLKGCSKLRKNELFQLLHQTMADPEFIHTLFPWFSNGELYILEQLERGNIPLVTTDIMFSATDLLRHGVCFMDESGKHLVMPTELKVAYLAIREDKTFQKQQEENGFIYDCCNAAVYFYGVYPISELCERIQKQLKRPFSEQNLRQWHKGSRINREDFLFKNGLIISAALQETPEDVVALQQIQNVKKRTYWPDAEAMESLRAEQWVIDDNFYLPFWDFAPILMENEFGDIMSVSRFVEGAIRTGAPFDALMGFLSEQVFAFESMEQVHQFAAVMQTIWNNTPMWENCGYSLNQLKTLSMQKNTQKKPSRGTVISLEEHRAKRNK